MEFKPPVKSFVIVDTRTNEIVVVKNRIMSPASSGMTNSFVRSWYMQEAQIIELAKRLEITYDDAKTLRTSFLYRRLNNPVHAPPLTELEKFGVVHRDTIDNSFKIKFNEQTTFVKKLVSSITLED